MRILLSALTALAVVTTAAVPAFSAPCRDGRGRFVKCGVRPMPPKRCRDNRGKFMKCDIGRDNDRNGPRNDDRGPGNRGH
ncbi:MAG: hypothetical protein ABF760_03635 [Zymomonas mobilis]|uniref:Uncharacterized protein n=1 Tax=Zymomonas mobilis TaxID=542 RepID=A0A542W0X7_ZYMMB|nr:hypothetical protein [Zymomonas mobilis]TQL17241.1 hypothetical protein FBY58_0811 [Zymomonas mobilis]